MPDLAGWRRSRLPEPGVERITIAPDWVCEIHSPSTRRHDLKIKRPFYARVGVGHLWYVDLEARTLTASRLEDAKWVELGVWCDDDRAHVTPFEELELDLAAWWPPAPRAL